MLIDAHAHIDRYSDELPSVLDEISRERILTISVSMDIPSFQKNLELSRSCSFIVPAFGIHPWEAARYAHDLQQINEYLERAPLIGEIGLDRRFIRDESLYPKQRAVLEHILEFAARRQRLVNLHTAGAEREVLNALQTFGISRSIVHWYSGPPELIDPFISAGSYFSVGVEVLSSPAIQRIARQLPLERLLTETDNPGGFEWLAGKPGRPILLRDVVAKLAELRHQNLPELESQVLLNFKLLAQGIDLLDQVLRTEKN